MLDAAKIRMTKIALRHVGTPALVLGVSMLIGAGINHLARPAIAQWKQHAQTGDQSNNELASRFMAAELMAVEPVNQAKPAQPSNLRRGSFAKAGAIDNQPVTPSAATTPAPTPVATPTPVAASPAVTTVATAATPTVVTSLEARVTQAVMTHEDHAAAKQTTVASAPAPAPAPAVVKATAKPTIPAGHRIFNGRLIRPARTITMVTTAYSPDERSCGPDADGTTASGKSVWTNGMKMAAADTRLLPFGTLISVPGYYGGQPVPVLDRGGAIKGNRLDMLYPTHEIAITWGRKTQKVTVWEYVD